MPLFKIDDEPFLSISGFPDLPKQRLEPIERPGIDGTGFWELGTRGRPFTIRTQCDFASFSDAADAIARYASFCDRGLVPITIAGVCLDVYAVRFQVLDVRPAGVAGCLGVVGGINPPSYGWAEADWDLYPVPNGD